MADKVEKQQTILEYLKRFPFYKWAAKAAGISEDTLKVWRDEDTEFSDRVEIARSEGIRYFGGKASPDLILKSADPETFAQAREDDKDPRPLVIIHNDGDKTITVANESLER